MANLLLYCLMPDGSSDTQSALPSRNTGFFKKLRPVLITLAAILGLLSLNLDY